MLIAVGCDIDSISLKEEAVEYLKLWGHEIQDFGATLEDKAEYPKYAYLVAKSVAKKQAVRGILFSDTGLEMAVVANKVKGVRAVRCVNWREANFARQVLSSNVLCMGNDADLWQVMDNWLAVEFEMKNDQVVMQITQIEQAE